MNVKGTAFLTRKDQVIRSFGKEKWETFFNRLKEMDHYFNNEPAPVALMPVKSFLLLNEEMIKTFYENDQKMYWAFGEHSAAWALTEGPYKVFMTSKNLSSFIEQTMPLVWSTYYTEGKMVGVIDQKSITVKIKGITTPHIYFEYTTMSFVKKALELFGLKNIRHECVNGFDSGHEEIHYVFYFD